jgi:hypothetical protein
MNKTVTIKRLVTRFESPNNTIALRDNTTIQTKYWFVRERDRWHNKEPRRHLISVATFGTSDPSDVKNAQIALAEVEDPIDFDLFRPLLLDRDLINSLDRGNSYKIPVENRIEIE